MAFNTLAKALAASLFLSATVLASDVANSSQNVVPNTMDHESIDPSQVAHYKSLFDELAQAPMTTPATQVDPAVLDTYFKWTDVVDVSDSTETCSQACLACAAGCSPACCVGRGRPEPLIPPIPSDPDSGTGTNSGRSGGILPSPLACPCTCGVGCPVAIQGVCCVGGGSKDAAAADQQKPLGGGATAHEDIGGKPQACPCTCGVGCPVYIQDVCCVGGGSKAEEKEGPSHGLVMQTTSGDPVSVLAAVNLTVEQSFITLDLVRGLERTGEIEYVKKNGAQGHFEVVLDVVAGEKTVKQAFQVIDGAKLWEREQVLLGLLFVARFEGLSVKEDVLKEVAGLSVLTGTRNE
ncbi:hypothetical protein EDD36DRAFT_423755 [Exophiala viscosa]|uniref:Uncharacterized protein n=1 Tax=Exophiala viscosa TaxID=2486360 RepID=A0AAN6DKT0_9EURO|nr:hypothetical protein EDD36DRAFT_423755 [Exophiala viscosa]